MAKSIHRDHQPRTGFTLIELLVVISLITVLIAILLPALQRARASARSMACLSNQRQIGTTLHIYAVDHRDYFPAGYLSVDGSLWFQRLAPYDNSFDREAGRKGMWSCPAFQFYWKPAISSKQNGNYATSDRFNNKWFRQADVPKPTQKPFLLDSYQKNAGGEVWHNFHFSRFRTQNWDGRPYYYHNDAVSIWFIAGNASTFGRTEAGALAEPVWLYTP